MAERTIGVVGAGVIGTGVAQAGAEAGYRVVLADLSEEILHRATEEIRHSVMGLRLVRKGGPKPDEVLGHIECVTSIDRLAEAEFVIENVPERWDAKEPLWRELDRLCPAESIFAANTSAIPIAKLAALTTRAPRVLGMHFMNPVPLKDAVEVIRGPQTSDETLDSALALLASMGKEGIVVSDAPGFVSNRVLMLTINEALEVLAGGVAAAETIDSVFTRCFGHAMGPLATADLIGLDTVLHTLEVLHDELGGERFRPARLLTELVAQRKLGRKTGAGVFEYPTRR